jgi:hypothetical protein
MRVLDLDAIPVVENEVQTLLEPYVESQKVIQQFIDSNQETIRSLAASFNPIIKTADSIQKSLASIAIQQSFEQMQKVGELAVKSLQIPDISHILPREFGHLYLDVLEEREVVVRDVGSITLLPYEEKMEIVMMVADELETRGFTTVKTVQPQPLLLAEAGINHIAVLPLHEEKRIVVIVNNDYEKPITRSLNKSWGMFLRTFEGEEFSFAEHRGVWDYFNHNNRCPLYTRTGYNLTQVFGSHFGKTVVLIEKEILTKHRFTRRTNQST